MNHERAKWQSSKFDMVLLSRSYCASNFWEALFGKKNIELGLKTVLLYYVFVYTSADWVKHVFLEINSSRSHYACNVYIFFFSPLINLFFTFSNLLPFFFPLLSFSFSVILGILAWFSGTLAWFMKHFQPWRTQMDQILVQLLVLLRLDWSVHSSLLAFYDIMLV